MKQELRRKMIDQLKSIRNRSEIEQAITEKFIQTSTWKASQTIGFYYSIGFEWDTHRLIEQALSEGKIASLPRTNPHDRSMTFYQYTGHNMLENVYQDLWEPIPSQTRKIEANEHDLLLVPGIIFDRSGYRIGYGGGYYDRYLIKYHHSTISIATDSQIIRSIPHENHDLPVERIVTDTEIIDCT